jgi:hypothetical protein
VRRVAAVLLALLSAVAVARLGCACSGSGTEGTADGSTDAMGALDVRRESVALDSPGGDGGVPEGWIPFNDYDPSCGFYVPTSAAVLPPPIQWQPCDPSYVQPPGIACQQMVATWTPPTPGYPLGTALAPGWFMSNGVYMMAIARAVGNYTYLLVAEADGPVHSALLATYAAPCNATPVDLRDGRVVYQVYDSEAKGKLSEYGGGALVANIDDLAPRVLLHYHDQGTRSYSVGLPGVLETTTMPGNVMILHDWLDGSKQQQIWSTAMDNGLQEVPIAFVGASFFWEATTLPISKLKIWDADAGARDFIAYGTDTTQGAGNLWTDGHDMVWLYGSNRTNPNDVYPTVAYMTSPFTTDAAALQPRRLRSEVGNGFGTGQMQVGCGYAAWESYQGIRLVRLSDGVSWMLPTKQGSTWLWADPLAITCTEVFARAAFNGDAGWQYSGIARVRIDSLGPGIPAD